MTDKEPVFIKDDQIVNPYFEKSVVESPRPAAVNLLRKSKQDGKLPVDLKAICEFESVPLRFVHIADENTAARFVQTKGEWFFEVDNEGTGESDFSENSVTRRRQRFSLAHELGHYKLESHCNTALQGALLSGHNPHSTGYLLQKETQANEFATELLLPLTELQPLLRGLDFKSDLFGSMENIADKFDASMTATVKRVASILDVEVIAIHFAPDGKSHQLPSYSPAFKNAGFYFARDGVIPNNTFAATMFDGKTTSTRGRKAYPDSRVWFPSRRRDDYKTVEWSFHLGRFGILVFLELIENDSYSSRY